MKKRKLRKKLRTWKNEARQLRRQIDSFEAVDIDAYQARIDVEATRATRAERRADELATKLAERSTSVGMLRGRIQELEAQAIERRGELERLRKAEASPDEWRDRARSMEAEVRRLEEATKDKGRRLDEMRAEHEKEAASMRAQIHELLRWKCEHEAAREAYEGKHKTELTTLRAERDGSRRAFHAVGDALRELVRERDELARAKTDGAIGNLFGALADAVTRAHRAAFGPAPAANDATEALDPAPKRKVPRRPVAKA